MPLQRKGVLIPVEGVDFSQPSMFISDRGGFPQNMRFYRNEIRKRPGKSLLGGIIADSTQIMGYGKLELNSGDKFLVRASKAKIESFNTATDTWDSITNTPLSGGDEDFVQFVTVTEDGILVITNGFDVPRKWTGSGNNTALGGNPGLAKYCAYLSPYLLLAYTTEAGTVNPWKVKWSDTNDPDNWTTGNAGSAILGDEPSPIQNITKLNDFIVVYKKESIYLGRKVDTADIFLFDPIRTGIGLAAPRAFAEAEGVHYFMGANDFYTFNGINVEPIGKNVKDDVFSRIDRDKINRCFALHVQEQSEVWFFIVISGYSWATEVWKYNYRLGLWYFDTCDNLTCGIKWERVDTETWDSGVGTWDEDEEVWDASATVAAWEDIVFGLSTGYSQVLDYSTTDDNNVAVSAHFISKDYIGDQLEFNKRWLQLDAWLQGVGTVYVDYSTNEGSTWVNIPYTSSTAYITLDEVNRKYELYFDVISDKIRFRFRNAVSGETFYLRNFYPYYLGNEQIMTRR